MDFSSVALSTLSSYDASSSVSSGSLAYAVATEVLDQALDLDDAMGASMLRMLEQSVTPGIGGGFDMSI